MDREAVTRVLVRDRLKLLAYLQSLVRDHAAAEDLYQDVLILATEKCESIKEERRCSLGHARQLGFAPSITCAAKAKQPA